MKNLNKTELTSKGYTHVSFQKIIDLNGLQPLDIYEHFKNDNSIFFESAEESKNLVDSQLYALMLMSILK
jgi:hypothetical protein